MAKEEIIHKDLLGQPLSVGMHVATAIGNTLYVCKVAKVTPKMIRAVPVKGNYRQDDGYLKYSTDTVVLSGPDVLAYILTYAK